MSVPDRTPHRPRARIAAGLALFMAGCAPSAPRTAVHDLSWACSERRCSVTFRLENADSGTENLAVRVRAYAGESVQKRRIVGEHTERLRIAARKPRTLTVGIDTTERANRVRVLLEFDDR
jgi:hypothetical protein